MTRPTASFFFSGDKTSGNHRFQFLHTIIPYIHEIDISFNICRYDLPINSVLVALYCIPSFNVFLLAVLDQIFCFSHPPPISSLKTHTIISPLTTHSSSSSTPSRYLRLAIDYVLDPRIQTPELRPPLASTRFAFSGPSHARLGENEKHLHILFFGPEMISFFFLSLSLSSSLSLSLVN